MLDFVVQQQQQQRHQNCAEQLNCQLPQFPLFFPIGPASSPFAYSSLASSTASSSSSSSSTSFSSSSSSSSSSSPTTPFYSIFQENINNSSTNISGPSQKDFIQNMLIRAIQLQHQMLAAENAALEQAKLTERAALAKALRKEEEGQKRVKKCQMDKAHPRAIKLESQERNPLLFDDHASVIGSNGQQQQQQEHFLTRCGITWKYMATAKSDKEFDELRRRHQVSKNRHVGYGTRYACTRNAKSRDNCPYLMLCIPGNNGTLKVYHRNAHTHPIRHIRTRDSHH